MTSRSAPSRESAHPALDATVSAIERELVQTLRALASERDEAETTIVRQHRSDLAAAEREVETSLREIESRYRRKTADRQAAYERKKQELIDSAEAEEVKARHEFEGDRFRIGEQADHDENATKKAWDEAKWTAETVYEAQEHIPQEKFDKTTKALRGQLAALQGMESEAAQLLQRFRIRRPATDETGLAPAFSDESARSDAMEPVAELDYHRSHAAGALARMRGSRMGRLFQGVATPFVVFIVLPAAAAAALLGWATQWRFDDLHVAFGIGAGLCSLGLGMSVYMLARTRLQREYVLVVRHSAAAQRARETCLALASEARARDERELLAKRDRDLKKAQDSYGPRLEKIRELRGRLLAELNEEFERRTARRRADHAAALHNLDERHEQQQRESKEKFDRTMAEAQGAHEARVRDREAAFRADWQELESRWKNGLARVRERISQLATFNAESFLPWTSAAWRQWRFPAEPAPAIRFGDLSLDLAAIPGGLPKDPRLIDNGPTRFTMPAALDFPSRASLLIEADEAGRDRAIATLQNLMSRLLTTLPPGKVRFTIIDPVGLGQNFAGFMHLADFDEQLVSDRIWTESRHIEQRLADLTEHMENVIQKYLRNDFETITEYNEQAGEIAEPFRFLVIANFPVNFTDTAARRLVSIVDSGPRCGVFTLIAMDTRQPLPQGLAVEDLRRNCVVLNSDAKGVRLRDPVFEELPLALELPPSSDLLTDIVHRVGEAAKDLTRVEVPFEHVVPPGDNYWQEKSDYSVKVPLGRAGAKKLQPLEVGRGIAQHVLIAGKTGSGKSTLLHVLVTNLALHYRPDEVEFYLVDFKKGVEFKTYATHNLPHARVVAIESDREFGLSVLQRVDAELRRRGEIFRELGVQDIAGFRRTESVERIPRTLLIVDEFQEFFTEDDKLAQDASLLLDRLVRQGRAFGIHIILGSQTLAGAYSLARSTIGQMAVRIALQCSETDAMLIMSEDNSAARLLTRPGEAIYNDQSGLIEGNNPFQIVWLPEPVREKYLLQIEELAAREGYRPPSPQIVFEGNVPADIRRNELLARVLDSAPAKSVPPAPQAWLGEAISIKDPTAAIFRRQSGTNLLMIGQREEAALAMQLMSLIALAAQQPHNGPIFYVLDGMPADSSHKGAFEKVAKRLPHDVRIVGWHEVEGAMAEIDQELCRRQQSQRSDAPPIFVFIYGMQRFRMLRQEEEFGFSSSSGEGEARKSDKVFGDLLRDGPPLGMHAIAWIDTVNNLSRAFDRKTLREFDMRILFQMSSTDSSNLIDTPVAGLLGPHRALFHSEDHGILEKFRPYALPESDWLGEVEDHLRR
jgi:hypothetical protein